ncbi:small RNA 2'-O-methyltransferase [Scyliorhinus canicula]|uniref:small RNA 2'-O-methyltransferase n=1 Tax=Scyliorhinus canicula TaxID=7830 RepID=UPI0018F37E0C|nr:small RNA 2'-O-methyltransferase [Scyliorhinus canicula]
MPPRGSMSIIDPWGTAGEMVWEQEEKPFAVILWIQYGQNETLCCQWRESLDVDRVVKFSTGGETNRMETMNFTPPLYKQRYQLVFELVEKYGARKVADLGCAECTLLSRLKFCSCIELLVGVDTDLELLKQNMYRLSPLPCEYLQPRPSLLTVMLYHGSATVKDPRMLDCDFVSCVELSLDIGNKYGYRVEFSGVGKGPPGAEELGFCTQISIFLREHSKTTQTESEDTDTLYKLVYEIVYPSLKDKKILQDIVLNEVIYAAECERRHLITSQCDDIEQEAENCSHNERESLQTEDNKSAKASFKPKRSERLKVCKIGGKLHIPLINLFSIPKVQQLSGSLQQLQDILQATDRVMLSACGSSVLYPADDHTNDD